MAKEINLKNGTQFIYHEDTRALTLRSLFRMTCGFNGKEDDNSRFLRELPASSNPSANRPRLNTHTFFPYYSLASFYRFIRHYITNNIAFTLVELLVVISIIAILASLLLPALGKCREVGKKIVCLNKEKNLHAAYQNYLNDMNEYFFGYVDQSEQGWFSSTELKWVGDYIPKIYPYQKDSSLLNCPALPEVAGTYSIYSNYAYSSMFRGNMHNAPGTTVYVNLASVSSPSIKVIFTDGTASSDWDGAVMFNFNTSRIAWVHISSSNTVFLDGHAKSNEPGTLTSSNYTK